MKKEVLFVHQNFPGQYKHLAPALAQSGVNVTALGMRDGIAAPGVRYVRYAPERGTTPNVHPWVADFETKVIRGQACLEAAARLARTGYRPDLICAHPGWGEPLFLRELWPDTPQLHYLEFYYRATGQDIGFDPEFGEVQLAQKARLVAKNANNLLNLHGMDAGMAPTQWQFSTLPQMYRNKVKVIHDGVDTRKLTPNKAVQLKLLDDRQRVLELDATVPLITFVNRNLEPMRGYHTFMRALPEMLDKLPQAKVVIVGGDGVSYGATPQQGSWKTQFADEVRDRVDWDRVHFVGRVPYSALIDLFRLSWAHVYLTYPFVLSWSMLEAMSVGAPVIASRTAPVLEVIEHGRNGWLVDFFDPQALARQVVDVVTAAKDIEPVRQAARQTITDRFDLHTVCLPQQLEWTRHCLG